MSLSESEGVIDRKLTFCPLLSSSPTDELIRTCDNCDCFFVYCCHCNMKYGNGGRNANNSLICHHFRLVFTDGACRMNGQAGATAGIGVACGEEDIDQRSIAITDDLDPGQRRTSQRAELLAALAGLDYLTEAHELYHDDEKKEGRKRQKLSSEEKTSAWVIATDSEYVVKGMTEWLPTWKVRKPLSIFQQSIMG